KAIGKEEWINDPRYDTMEKRDERAEEIIQELDKIFAEKTWAEWEKKFKEYDLIASGNQTIPEILEDEQARANNFFTDIEHPIIGEVRLLNSPLQFSETPAEITSVAPQLGAHTEEVLLAAGYTWKDLEEMKEQKVIP
ncbi:MAG: CoA transferase, partial [candidate division KSB1 bacterium]|nr:CoA transferase [candidate division KSB1 bacterium]